MKLLLAAATLALGLGLNAEIRGIPVALAPVINTMTIAPSPAEVGVPVTFSVTATGGPGLEYQWDFGDGNVRSFSPDEATIEHTYLKPGHFIVRINVLESGDPTPATQTQQLLVHYPLTTVKPTNSSPIILDAARQRVWVVNADSDTISSVTTTAPHTKDREIPVGKAPRTLAQAADGRIWVVSQQNPVISVINPDTGALEHVVGLPHGSLPYGIAMSPDGSAAYVSFQGSGGIAKFSTASRDLLALASDPPSARGIAVSSTGRVFVTRFLSPVEPPLTAAGQLNSHGQVVEYDENLGFVRLIKLKLDPGPDSASSSRGIPNYISSMMITPDGRRAYVPSKKDNIQKGTSTVRDGVVPTQDTAMRTIVSAIDLTASSLNDTLNERIDLDNSEMAQSACTSPKGDYIFIGVQGTNRVMVRDLYNNTTALNGFGTLTTGLAPQGLVFDPATNKLFVNNFMTRDVTVFDATAVLAGAPVFSMPVVTKVPVVALELLPNVASVPPTTPNNDVLKGKQIFYNSGDTRMSLEGYISCAGCHLDGGSDGRVWDFTNRGEGLRNTTMLQGRGGTGHGFVHWSANFDEIQDFEHDIRGAFGGSGFLTNPQFAATNNPYTQPRKAGLNADLDALAAYVTSLTTVARSPFRNPDGTLTAAGDRGEAVFRTLQCATCHGGARFSDSTVPAGFPNPAGFPTNTLNLHNVGTLKGTSGNRLNGGAGSLYGIDTPTLKGLWQTAPYFHDGSAATIMDVINAVPLSPAPATAHGSMHTLSQADKDDLAAYLLQIDELDAAPAVVAAPTVTIDFVSTGKPYSLGLTTPNELPYIDRSYRLNASIVSPGFILIRTADDDKAVTAAEHLKFTAPIGTQVYIIYDSRGMVPTGTPPTWLTSGWTPLPGLPEKFVGLSLPSSPTMEYWQPTAPTTVTENTLGGNLAAGASGALHNYFVLLLLPVPKPYAPFFNEGPIAQEAWAHDQDSDGDGVRDEFEATSALNPFGIDTGGAGISDEDKTTGGGTFFSAQPAYSFSFSASSGAAPSGGGSSGGCGLLGLEYVLPLLALRLRRRRS